MSVLIQSPLSQKCTKPLKSSLSSSNSYILSISSLPEYYATSASAPSNVIDIFDKRTLTGIQTLPGHEDATTSLKSVDKVAGITRKSLISTGRDGSVKVWDERSNSHSIKMTNLGKSRALLCCDASPDGLTVAAGTDLRNDDAFILYWDPRQPAVPLRTHGSTHSDDITTLSFCHSDTAQKVLLSGSSDGLISLSNPEEDDEDEAVLCVANWGCSISQAGWIDTQNNRSAKSAKIWAASDMETFSTWSEELDQFISLDIREPSVHSHGQTWVTDYLITSHNARLINSNLGVFVGSNEGDFALLSNMNLSAPDAPWCLHNLWTNNHTEIVRSVLWDEENDVIVSGGEDAKIHVWPGPTLGNGQKEDDAMEVDTPMSPSRKRDLERDFDPEDGKRARR